MRRLCWLVFSLTIVAPARSSAAECSKAVEDVERKLSIMAVAKDSAGTMRSAVDVARAALPGCPGEELLWYLVAGSEPARLDEAARRFPKSARIATLKARREGTVQSAQAALAIDPGYAPALVALGKAQWESGEAQAAIRTLTAVRDLDRVPGGANVLARAYLERGDAAAADKVLSRPVSSNPIEPTVSTGEVQFESWEIRGLIALARKQNAEAVRWLVKAGTAGRENAGQILLERHELASERKKYAASPSTPAEQKAWMRSILR